MDHLKIAAAALIAALSAPLLAQAAFPAEGARIEGKSIAVLSDGTAKAKPDITKIILHFTSYGWTAEKSGRKVDQNIKKFLDNLASEKIPVAESEIGDIRLKPSYQFNRDLKTNVPADFLVTRQLTLMIDDETAVERVLDESLKIGSFALESVRHTLKDKTKLRDESYRNALEAGRQKAERLAKTMGMEIGTIQSVEELSSDFSEINMIEDTEIAAVLSSQIPVEKAGQAESASGMRAQSQDFVQARTNLKITFSAK